jgi:hypothetical protein
LQQQQQQRRGRKEDWLSEQHRAAPARRTVSYEANQEVIEVTKTIKTLQVWTVADGGLLESGKCKDFLKCDSMIDGHYEDILAARFRD